MKKNSEVETYGCFLLHYKRCFLSSMNRYAGKNVKLLKIMTDYNNFAETFSRSRKNMKWEEIDYFISSYLSDVK
jgi:hypothetical protein